MEELFVKKFWEEEGILFYLHFQNNQAIRQIEVSAKGKFFLTLEKPQEGESMLYDQSLNELDLQDSDFIKKDEFESIWEK